MEARFIVFLMATALTCLSVAGCVVHSPASEAIIFGETRPASPDSDTYAGGTITYAPARALANELAALDYPSEPSSASIRDLTFNPRRMSGGFYRAYLDPGNVAGYSATLGVMTAGIDLTVKAYDPVFLTGVLSVGGQQALLQFRLVERQSLGIAMGLGYRRETYTYNAPEPFEFTRLSLGTYAIRGLLLYRDRGEGGGALKLTVHLGHSYRLKSMTFGFSLATGRY